MKGSARWAASLLALTAAGMFGLAATATGAFASDADTSISPAGPVPVSYACSLGSYGQSLAPLTLPATMTAASTGTTVTVELVTQPVQLATATAAALPPLNYLDVAGSASVTGPAGTAVSLAGQSAYQNAASGMTQLPAVTATGTVASANAGTAAIQAPETITLTPMDGSARPPLTCTTTSVTTVQVAIPATGVTGAAGTGQDYSCAISVGTATTTQQVPMRLTATRPGTVGIQGAVALSAPASALGSAFPGGAVPMSVTGSAQLGGSGTGSIPMTGFGYAPNGMVNLTGHWMPESPGPARIFAPHWFRAELSTQTTTTVVIACTAMTATTTSTQVMVTASASSAEAAAAGSAPASAAPGTAPGAPNTGGGGSLHPANELPLAAGGATAVLAGLGITGYVLRRRRGGLSQ